MNPPRGGFSSRHFYGDFQYCFLFNVVCPMALYGVFNGMNMIAKFMFGHTLDICCTVAKMLSDGSMHRVVVYVYLYT